MVQAVIHMRLVYARLLVLSFIGLTVGITVNAVFLQEISHPSPLNPLSQYHQANLPESQNSSGQNLGQPITQEAAKEAEQLEKDQIVSAAPEDNLIREIQLALIDKGYYPGKVDGLPGPTTRAAIMAFEYDHHIKLSGLADGDFLKIIREGADPSEMRRPIGVLIGVSQFVLTLQKSLNELGYFTGKPDGVLGPRTVKQIRAFERKHKMKITGRISGRLVAAIRRDTGKPFIVAGI